MRQLLHYRILILLLVNFSCSNGQRKPIDNLVTHPSWQANYYKYKTNKPNLPAHKIFRLGFEPIDTTLPIDNLSRVEIINANSTSLAFIPETILRLDSLKSLNLTWTNLNYFPRVVFQMPQLISLDFAFRDSCITLDTLAYNFTRLKNLELLSLISCQLRNVPESVTNLKRLKYLNLSQNKIKFLDNRIGNLDSLIELDLSQNKLINLPNDLSKLQSLEQLNLYNNKLTILSETVCQLNNLRDLDFRYNNIKSLPKEILNLKSIESLDFSNNESLNITNEFAKEINRKLPNLKSIVLINTNHTDNQILDLIKIFKDKVIFFVTD